MSSLNGLGLHTAQERKQENGIHGFHFLVLVECALLAYHFEQGQKSKNYVYGKTLFEEPAEYLFFGGTQPVL